MADGIRALTGVGAVSAVTLMLTRVVHVTNNTTVALTFLLVVLLVAAASRFWVAALTSLVALFCFNFFFIPPVGTLSVADPENWVALAAFLAVSIVGSMVSATMRERERQALDRLQLLEERKLAEIARQRDALTSALLDSIGHDLRTPLTALKVAATNLQSAALDEKERGEQAEIALAEVERLAHLFENILEMARIDARAIAARRNWVHPLEIYEAARDQVSRFLDGHKVQLSIKDEAIVLVDPKLTAAALARVLENAARYAPAGTTVHVEMSSSSSAFSVTVADDGPGIPPGDEQRIFDRLYRGRSTARHTQGTGMGLAIARGLLLAEKGSISGQNCPGGGAKFTIVVPAQRRRVTEIRAAS